MDITTANGLGLLFVGLLAGIVAVASPGPVTLSVVEVGAARGRRPGMQASFGAFGGDAFLAPIAVAMVAAGASLPDRLFLGVRYFSVVVLVAMGGALVVRPTACQALAAKVRHPGRALFLFTVLSPSAVGFWLAMLLAMPFADDATKLMWFSAGIVLASAVVNLALGLASGALGPRLSTKRRVTLSRLGGFAMVALAALAMVSL